MKFDTSTYCEEIGREAWGYIEYREPIAPEQAAVYELTQGKADSRVLVDVPDENGRTVSAEKTLYFEGAGWSGANISKDTIGNCRIRTAFHLDDGRAVYLEILGFEKTKHNANIWQYTGFVDFCYYITDDDPNDDCNKHHVMLPGQYGSGFEYTEKEILSVVNGLGASFDAVRVVPELGGYRVFPEKKSGKGPAGYYYGDEFHYDPELTARREMVYK